MDNSLSTHHLSGNGAAVRLTPRDLATIAADNSVMWLRIRRLVEADKWIAYYNAASPTVKSEIEGAFNRGDEIAMKAMFEQSEATNWRSYKVARLRMMAAAYGIPHASSLGKDLLLIKLQPFMENASEEVRRDGPYHEMGSNI